MGLRLHYLHGEAESAPLDTIPADRCKLQEELAAYNPDDIFNCDETALFFRMLPNQTLATKAVRGQKMDKERVTVLLGCNATGTEKLKPFVIGKSTRPRALRGFNMDALSVHYRSNSKAWMRSDLFSEWLGILNQKMQDQGRKILLLLDNAACHGSSNNHIQFTNITLRYLPPNTTAHLQPLDAGIIAALKARYRNIFVKWLIDLYDTGLQTQKANLKNAIDFLAEAWDSLPAEAIQNCWRHTGIIFQVPDGIVQDLPSEQEIRMELASLIDQLPIPPELRMTPDDFVNIDNSILIEESMTDDEIVHFVLQGNVDNEDETEDNDDLPPEVRPEQALAGGQSFLSYWERQGLVTAEELRTLRKLLRETHFHVVKDKKQTNIDKFFLTAS